MHVEQLNLCEGHFSLIHLCVDPVRIPGNHLDYIQSLGRDGGSHASCSLQSGVI